MHTTSTPLALHLSLNGVLAAAKVDVALVLTHSLCGLLLWSETASDSAGLLVAHVEWDTLALVRLSDVLTLLLVDDGEDASDGLANRVAMETIREGLYNQFHSHLGQLAS